MLFAAVDGEALAGDGFGLDEVANGPAHLFAAAPAAEQCPPAQPLDLVGVEVSRRDRRPQRDRIGTNVGRELDGELSGECEAGGLRDAVGASGGKRLSFRMGKGGMGGTTAPR